MPIHQPAYQLIRDRKHASLRPLFPKPWLLPKSALPPASTNNILSIPSTCGILTPLDLEITDPSLPAPTLLHRLATTRYTAVQVCTSFCKRATLSHQLTHSITEPLFSSALARAEALDAHLARTGEIVGPLHGLPVSVKDSFDVRGHDSSVGIAGLCFRPARGNAAMVEVLLGAGAVVHVKTNVPQTLLALDSVNHVFGRVLNPLNRAGWTAGGSSGGEAALMAMGGAVMGIGTDVGGSVRIPAMCEGLVGFKPSTGRLPYGGQQSLQAAGGAKLGLEASAGVIARRCEDVGLMMKAVEGARSWEVDPAVVPGQWWSGEGVGLEGGVRTVGVIWTDGNTTLLPPVRRCMQDVVTRLESKGVRVVDVKPPRFEELQGLMNKFFNSQDNHHLFSLLEQTEEPLIPWLRKLGFRRHDGVSVAELRELWAKRVELQQEMLKMFKTEDGQDVDAIILPVAPHPVPGIDEWGGVGYTGIFVLLDWPAVSIPIRKCGEQDLVDEVEGPVLGRWDKMNRALWDKSKIDRTRYLDSPLSVQLIAPKLQEKRLWDVSRYVEEIFREELIDVKAKL